MERVNFFIIDRDEISRNIITCYLSEICGNIDHSISQHIGIDELEKDLLSNPNNIILYDISIDNNKLQKDIKEIKSLDKNAIIVALSNKTSSETIIKALRSGAKEFLTKPIIKTDFEATILDIINELNRNETPNSCKIISTFSNKGGIGKTSIAVNLAMELAQMSKEKVALVDLNLQLGDIATFLDMTPTFAMDYIAKNINNLEEEELLQSLSRYKNTSLYVIADPLNIANSKEITAEEIKNILNTLKKTFTYIVIDIGTNIDSKTITALDLSDLILLIAIVNLPAIRNTQRCIELFEKLRYPQNKIKLILNRYMENDEIKTTDIEEAVKQKVYWKIPNNYLTMMSAINKGVPVNSINAQSNIAINFRELATKISDYLITEKFNTEYKDVR